MEPIDMDNMMTKRINLVETNLRAAHDVTFVRSHDFDKTL